MPKKMANPQMGGKTGEGGGSDGSGNANTSTGEKLLPKAYIVYKVPAEMVGVFVISSKVVHLKVIAGNTDKCLRVLVYLFTFSMVGVYDLVNYLVYGKQALQVGKVANVSRLEGLSKELNNIMSQTTKG